ncbi:MAG: hypothetical protein HQL46_14245, partial [Gammaproteobacteria bacterium]|nr:hypothetical protein [Gammaproteobacteria bacterium]
MLEKLKLFWQEVMSEVTISKEKTFTMNIAELKNKAELLHPVGFYILAIKLFKQGEKDEVILTI